MNGTGTPSGDVFGASPAGVAASSPVSAVLAAASDRTELADLAAALADLGRRVRDVVRAGRTAADGDVVRVEGGDEVFGVDVRAETVVLDGLAAFADRWPGRVVMEGLDAGGTVGSPTMAGAWTYLIDPVDGSRLFAAGKRSAWVLLGAGRAAATLEDLEVGAAVEIPTERGWLGRVAWAVRGGPCVAVDDDLVTGGPARPVNLAPLDATSPVRRFVTVARGLHRPRAALAAWEDDHLGSVDGIEASFEDPYLCSGAQMLGVASGTDVAVLDPRPLVGDGLCAHPYDLAAIVVARAAGAIVEALPPGPLHVPLDCTTAVAWAAYANPAVADVVRRGFGGRD